MNDSAESIMGYLAHKYFNSECFVTHEKFKPRGFVIHHLRYIDNDVRRENYPKGEKGRLSYLRALRTMVEREPFRFMLLKNGMHTKLDHYKNGLCRMKRDNVMRLYVAWLLTEKKNIIKKQKHYKRYKK